MHTVVLVQQGLRVYCFLSVDSSAIDRFAARLMKLELARLRTPPQRLIPRLMAQVDGYNLENKLIKQTINIA